MPSKKKEAPEVKEERDNFKIISDMLKEAREEKKISIEDIQEELKIKRTSIEYIEQGKLNKLPGGIYTRSYLKTYAEFVGIEPDKILDLYDNIEEEQEEEAKQAGSSPYQSSFSPSAWIIILSLAAGLMIYGYWHYKEQKEPGRAEVIETDTEIKKIYNAPKPNVLLVANEPTNLIILDNKGSIVVEKELIVGDVFFLPKQEGLILKSEPENSISIYVEGEEVISLSNLETQFNGLVLDINKLLANVELPESAN